MHPKTKEMYDKENPHFQVMIISMILDEFCDKHEDMVNEAMNEAIKNEMVESITDGHWCSDKDLIAPIPRGMTKSFGELKFVEVSLDDIYGEEG